jgi:hypothetical protein
MHDWTSTSPKGGTVFMQRYWFDVSRNSTTNGQEQRLIFIVASWIRTQQDNWN